MGLEGIVSKRLTAPYRSGVSKDWIKVKNPDSAASAAGEAGEQEQDRWQMSYGLNDSRVIGLVTKAGDTTASQGRHQ
jgi:hypothetical protein